MKRTFAVVVLVATCAVVGGLFATSFLSFASAANPPIGSPSVASTAVRCKGTSANSNQGTGARIRECEVALVRVINRCVYLKVGEAAKVLTQAVTHVRVGQNAGKPIDGYDSTSPRIAYECEFDGKTSSGKWAYSSFIDLQLTGSLPNVYLSLRQIRFAESSVGPVSPVLAPQVGRGAFVLPLQNSDGLAVLYFVAGSRIVHLSYHAPYSFTDPSAINRARNVVNGLAKLVAARRAIIPPRSSTTTTTSQPLTPTTPAPQSCSPLTDSGNCYEPGEYCRNSDHGVTGVAGDGETITCSYNDGWRWEPSGVTNSLPLPSTTTTTTTAAVVCSIGEIEIQMDPAAQKTLGRNATPQEAEQFGQEYYGCTQFTP